MEEKGSCCREIREWIVAGYQVGITLVPLGTALYLIESKDGRYADFALYAARAADFVEKLRKRLWPKSF